jgi:hypothetical protein
MSKTTTTMPRRSTQKPELATRPHFLSLPLELRLEVYGYLLPIRKSLRRLTSHSQILRANKQCYAEARPLFQRLNPIQLQVNAYVLSDGLPDDPIYYDTTLYFGEIESNLSDALSRLPLAAGSYHDVRGKWDSAIRHGCKLDVELALVYKSLSLVELDKFLDSIQAGTGDVVGARAYEGFEVTNDFLIAGEMSFAEISQLAFALEHLAPSSAAMPVSYVNSRAWNLDNVVGHKVFKMLTQTAAFPEPVARTTTRNRIAERMATRGANMVPKRMVELLSKHRQVATCSSKLFNVVCDRRAPFRQELGGVLAHLKGLRKAYEQRRPGLPYAGPPVVQTWLPTIERWFRREYARHMAGEVDLDSETSSL